jgi:hypothetical protein
MHRQSISPCFRILQGFAASHNRVTGMNVTHYGPESSPRRARWVDFGDFAAI